MILLAKFAAGVAGLYVLVVVPALPTAGKGQSGRLLRRPQRDHHAATVVDFCTAVPTG
jgi:hypothetical protein